MIDTGSTGRIAVDVHGPTRTTFADDCERGPACEWHPLEKVADLLSERGDNRIDPGDFMYMGATGADTGVAVRMFKHCDTRRYLNLDANGHAYRYTPTGSGGYTYRLQNLDAAIAHALS